MAMTTRSRRDPWAFDRYDRWGLSALLGLAVVVFVIGGVVLPVRAALDGAPVPVEVYAPVVVPGLADAGVEHGIATFDVLVPVDAWGLRVISLLPGVLVALLVLAGAWLVLRVMGAVSAGDPFARVNVVRLRWLAAILVIGSVAVSFLELAARGALLGDADLGALRPATTLSVPWVAILVGMVVALLAEAFRVGSRMREDLEGLV